MSSDRRTPRQHTRDTLAALIDFGEVVSTTISSSVKNVLATIRGEERDDVSEERESALWGHAALLYRPPPGTELIYVRRGDELVPIASRETRWQVSLEEDEVVLRNLSGDTPARVRLLANGEVLIEAGKVGHVAPGDAMAVATKALALAEKCDSNFETVKFEFDTHTHVAGTLVAPSGGGAVTGASGAPVAPMANLQDVASARVFTKD